MSGYYYYHPYTEEETDTGRLSHSSKGPEKRSSRARASSRQSKCSQPLTQDLSAVNIWDIKIKSSKKKYRVWKEATKEGWINPTKKVEIYFSLFEWNLVSSSSTLLRLVKVLFLGNVWFLKEVGSATKIRWKGLKCGFYFLTIQNIFCLQFCFLQYCRLLF